MDVQWPLVVFTTLVGLGAGLIVGVALNSFAKKTDKVDFTASVIALIAVVAGGFASVLHLSHPDRIFAALGHPTLGIFTEALLTGLLIVAIVILLILMARKASDGAKKAVAAIGGAIAILIMFMLGYSYIMPARPAWDTVLLPLTYFATGAAMGLSAYLLLCVVKDKDNAEARKFSGVVALAACALAFVLVLAFCAASGAFSANALLAIVVVVCLLAAGIAAWFASKKGSGGMAVTVVIIAVAGAFLFRILMWLLGAPTINFFGF